MVSFSHLISLNLTYIQIKTMLEAYQNTVKANKISVAVADDFYESLRNMYSSYLRGIGGEGIYYLNLLFTEGRFTSLSINQIFIY